jgi:hypothetical protein
MAQRLLKSEDLPRLSADVESEAYERKIIQNFTDASGRIKSLPAQEKKFQVLLRYVAKAFQPGRRYTERKSTKFWLGIMMTPLRCGAV